MGNKIIDHSDEVGALLTSNYSFILDLTPGFNWLGKCNCKTRWETFKLLGFGATYIKNFTLFKSTTLSQIFKITVIS